MAFFLLSNPCPSNMSSMCDDVPESKDKQLPWLWRRLTALPNDWHHQPFNSIYLSFILRILCVPSSVHATLILKATDLDVFGSSIRVNPQTILFLGQHVFSWLVSETAQMRSVLPMTSLRYMPLSFSSSRSRPLCWPWAIVQTPVCRDIT